MEYIAFEFLSPSEQEILERGLQFETDPPTGNLVLNVFYNSQLQEFLFPDITWLHQAADIKIDVFDKIRISIDHHDYLLSKWLPFLFEAEVQARWLYDSATTTNNQIDLRQAQVRMGLIREIRKRVLERVKTMLEEMSKGKPK